jgi:hypothetical protein
MVIMILSVPVKIKDIIELGRNFPWIKPDTCPRCGSIRIWGHGFILAFFDGLFQGVFLRRFRCPDCGCVIRMKPEGYFSRFQAGIETIRNCLENRLQNKRWNPLLSTSRQRHWLNALKRNAFLFFGSGSGLMTAFEKLVDMGKTPVCRSV